MPDDDWEALRQIPSDPKENYTHPNQERPEPQYLGSHRIAENPDEHPYFGPDERPEGPEFGSEAWQKMCVEKWGHLGTHLRRS